jgi:hypothetical protein
MFEIAIDIAHLGLQNQSNAYKLVDRIITQHPLNCERKYLIPMPLFMTIAYYKVIITTSSTCDLRTPVVMPLQPPRMRSGPD